LADQTCGCELIQKSYREPDPEVAEAIREAGETAARCWNCPNLGHKPSRDKLTDEQKEAFVAVSRLTGVNTDEFETCPRSYYNLNTEFGKDCERVINARKWRDKGQMQLIEPEPCSNMVEAIGLVDKGVEDLEHYHSEERNKKIKERNAELEKQMYVVERYRDND
jgi:hypothetical protein